LGLSFLFRNNKELGEAIRAERVRQNLRQPLISDLENGVRSVRVDNLLKVLAALDLDLAIVPRRKAEFEPAYY